MLNNLGLGFVFTARDLASGTMRKLGANFSQFSGRAAKNTMRMQAAARLGGASIGLLTAGVGALGGAYALAKTAGEFEQSLARVGAIARASAADLGVLRQAAIEAGMVTQFSPKEAADGLANFASQGFNAKDSAKALKPALDLAAGGMISVEQAAGTMSAAVKVFGGGVESAGKKADQLLRISNLTALQANDLEISLGNVARGAISAKQSIEEMLPAIGLVKNSGVDASVASTAISSALDFMAKNADKFKKEFGVSIADANGNIRPFLDIVREVNEAGKSMGTAEYLSKLTDTAGRFGKTAFATIGKQLEEGIADSTGKILKGAEAIEYLRREMHNATGAAKEFRDRLLDTLPGQVVILQGILQTLAVTIGEPLAKAFKPFVKAFADGMTRVIEFIEKIPAPVKELAGKMLLLFGVIATVGGVGAGIAALGVLLAGAMKAAAIAAAIAAAAIGALLLVVGAVKLAFRGYNIAMGDAAGQANSLTRAWDKLKLGVGAVIALVTGKPISKEMVDDLKKAENRGVFNFVQSVGRLILRAKRFLGGLAVGFKTMFIQARPVFDALFKAFEDLGDALGFGGDAFNNFAGKPVNKFIAAGFKVGRIIGMIIKFMVRVITFAINLITGVINGVKGAFAIFQPVIDLLVDSFWQVVDAARGLFIELGIVSEEAGENISIGQLFGKVLGFVASVIKLAVVPALIVFLQSLRFVLMGWTFVVRIFRAGVDAIVGFFKNTLAPYFSEKVAPIFTKLKEWAIAAFEPILDFITKIFDKVVELLVKLNEFLGLTDKVASAGEAVAGALGFTTVEMPTAMSLTDPEDVEEARIKALADAYTVRQASIPAAASPQGAAGAAVAATAGNTSGVSTEQAKRLMAMQSSLKLLNATAGALLNETKKGKVLSVDGQVLGTTSRAGRADADAREYRQTPVES